MVGNMVRSVGALVAIAAFLALGATRASAQMVNVAGSWDMEVTTQAGTTNPTMTLEQHDDHLMGHYSSATLGEADFEGSVNGSEIRISFNTDLQGQAVPVAYVATVDANGVMSGTIELAGTAAGTFTARRSSE